MNFRNISAWSIRNPVVPIVLFIGLTLAGIVSFMLMDVQDSPDIEFPVVIASISQPGAAPTEIRAATAASRFAYGPAIAIGSLVAVLIS